MSGQFDFVNTSLHRFACEQGATFNKALRYLDSCTRQPIAITGFTASMQVRDADGVLIVNLTTENGRIAITDVNLISLLISGTDTHALTAGSYFYDLDLINGGTVLRLLEGRFDVTAAVNAVLNQ
jgi:hypothetical protein